MTILSEGVWHVFEIAVFFYLLAGIIVLTHSIYDEGIIWTKNKKFWLLFLIIADECIRLLCGDIKGINIVFYILYYIIFLYGSRGNYIKRLWKALGVTLFSYFYLFMLSDILGYYMISGYSTELVTDVSWNTEEVVILSVTLLVSTTIYYYFSSNFLKKGIIILFRKREKCLIAFSFLYIVIMYSVMVLSIEEEDLVIMPIQKGMAAMVLFLGVLFPVFILKNRMSEYYRELHTYQEEVLALELSYFKEYKEMQEDIRRFRHDIWNHLKCVDGLLEEGRLEEMKTYLGSLLQRVEELSPVARTGDEIMDCIITAKYKEMQKEQILFQVEGILDCGLQWNPIDICAVFANALDNAIEACLLAEQTEEKEIRLMLKHTEQYYYIELSNPVWEDIVCEKLLEGRWSSKENKEKHGFGLQNMKHTVERYGGILKLDCKNKVFTVSIIVPR